MNRPTIIISSIIIIGIFGLMIWSKLIQQSDQPKFGSEPGTPSALTASEKLYDFGTISMAKGLVKNEFVLTNNTDKDIMIKQLYTSCMCTTAKLVRADRTTIGPFGMQGMDSFAPKVEETLVPGEYINIEVVYNPAAHGPAGIGPVDRFVYVVEETGSVSEFEIKAIVTP